MRPGSGIANLEIWDYYLSETLKIGAPYDVEAVATDHLHPEDTITEVTITTSIPEKKDPRVNVSHGLVYLIE